MGLFSGRTSMLEVQNQALLKSAGERTQRISDLERELQQAGDRAFAVLRAASEAVCERLPKDRRPPALMMALHIWALAHGIASLFGRGDAARRKLPMSPEELLEAAVLTYLQGLGLGEQRTGSSGPWGASPRDRP